MPSSIRPATVIGLAIRVVWIVVFIWMTRNVAAVLFSASQTRFDKTMTSLSYGWFVFFMTFPLGVIGILIAVLLGMLFGINRGNESILNFVLQGSGAFIGGYIQWFVLVPALARKWKRWRRNRKEGEQQLSASPPTEA